MKCKNCGADLVLMAVPGDDRHPEGSQAVPACSACGSRDYQDVTVDQMQGCWHNYPTGGVYRIPADGNVLEDSTKYKQRIAALESMLRELEYFYGRDGHRCPTCNRGSHETHAPDCRLKKLLEES